MKQPDTAALIRRLLKVTKTSQRTLAQRLGVTESYVSQLMSGKSNPTVRTLARIGEVTGRPLRITLAPPTLSEQERMLCLAT
jgi:transcriptional regulator with XRE-family HTH domain